MTNTHQHVELSYTPILSLDELQVPALPATPTTSDHSDSDHETGVMETTKLPRHKSNKLVGRRVTEPRSMRVESGKGDSTTFKICIFENINGNRAQEWPVPGIEGNVTISCVEERVQCVITTAQKLGKKKWIFSGTCIYHVLDSSSFFVCANKSIQLGIGFSTRVASGSFRIQLGILLTSQKGHVAKSHTDTYHHRSSSSQPNISKISPREKSDYDISSSSLSTGLFSKTLPPKTKSEPDIPTLTKLSPRFVNNLPSKSQTMRIHTSPRRSAIPTAARADQPEITEEENPSKQSSRADSRTRVVLRMDVDKTQGTSSGLES